MVKGSGGPKKRNFFRDLSSGIQAMRDHREGRLELGRYRIEPAKEYQLNVALMETHPPIWRRLRVPGDTTLARLDRIIQTAMGWTNSHLHTFTAGGVLYAAPSPEWDIPVKDERRVRLDRIASAEGEAFVYEYDLGDSWRHQVVVEEVRVKSGDAAVLLCLAGARACPPEDCGGVQGYYQTLKILRDPRHEEYQDRKTWIETMTGGPFDPDAFDVEAVNGALKGLR
jgi:hypothetical protein